MKKIYLFLLFLVFLIYPVYSEAEHYFSLDDSNYDTIGGVNGSVNGTGLTYTIAANCKWGTCLRCVSDQDSGVNNCFFNTNISSWSNDTKSLDFWFYVDNQYTSNTHIFGTNAGAYTRFRIWNQTGAPPYFYYLYGNGVEHPKIASFSTLNRWYHITLIRDTSSAAELYIDGVKKNTTAANIFSNNTNPYFFFTYNNGAQTPDTFEMYGRVDEIRFIGYKIPALQILNLNTTNTLYAKMDNCSFNFTDTANVIEVRDEKNNTQLDFNADYSLNYTTQIYPSYIGSYSNSVDLTPNISICLSEVNQTMDSTYSIDFSAPEYPERTLIFDMQYSPLTFDNITLYLLHEDAGIYARFMALDQYDNPIEDVLVEVELDGSSISEDYTDDSGVVTFFLDIDSDYTIIFTKSNYQRQIITIRPTSTDIYNVYMSTPQITQVNSYYNGLLYRFAPLTEINKSTIYNFTFNLSSSYWEITQCDLRMSDENGSALSTVTGTYTTSQCLANISFNTSTWNTLWLQGIIELNNTVNLTLDPIIKPQASNYTQFNLNYFLNDLKAFNSAGFQGDSDINWSLMMVAFLSICIITFGVSKFAGINSQEGVIFLIILLTWLFSYIQWLNLKVPSMPFPIMQQYMIFALVAMAGIGMVIHKNTG